MRILYRKLFSCNYGVWGLKVHTSQIKVKSRPWVDGSVAYVDITDYSNRHMASVNLAYSPVSNLENFLSIPHFFFRYLYFPPLKSFLGLGCFVPSALQITAVFPETWLNDRWSGFIWVSLHNPLDYTNLSPYTIPVAY